MEIRIRRSRLVGNHRYLGWTYHYVTPVDITWNHPDGASHVGPRAGAWAAANIGSIAELRKRLHRDFPEADLIDTWKTTQRSSTS
jgi:hypothetical protein